MSHRSLMQVRSVGNLAFEPLEPAQAAPVPSIVSIIISVAFPANYVGHVLHTGRTRKSSTPSSCKDGPCCLSCTDEPASEATGAAGRSAVPPALVSCRQQVRVNCLQGAGELLRRCADRSASVGDVVSLWWWGGGGCESPRIKFLLPPGQATRRAVLRGGVGWTDTPGHH